LTYLATKGQFLDKKQLAAFLGLSIFTIDSWVSQKREIPFVKMGKRVKFAAEDGMEWIENINSIRFQNMAIFKRSKTYYIQVYSPGRWYRETIALLQIPVSEMGRSGQSAQFQISPRQSISQINQTGCSANALSNSVLYSMPS
jgi:excisionase family DNA binding protein